MRVPTAATARLLQPQRLAIRLLQSLRYSSSSSPPPSPSSSPPSPSPTTTTSSSSSSTPPSWYSTTPLSKQLASVIKATGPISLAAYIRQCLTSSSGGYYTASSPDPFGARGDFITSPEISQMFGEMLGVWIVAEWMQQGRIKEGVQLIELGPGRGTLMDDVLRTLQRFPALASSIEGVYLIEASSVLRELQKSILCGKEVELKDSEDGKGYTATSKYNGLNVTWYEDVKFAPRGKTKSPFVLAHEFFDALPIHAFEATAGGWRELLVAYYPVEDTNAGLAPTTDGGEKSVGGDREEFGLTRANAPTRYSQFLPTISPRYTTPSSPGAIIEISPESHTIISDLSTRIGISKRGAALIIDYGPLSSIPTNSLRGIRGHRIVSPFHAPGSTDVSADVDFTALAERALEASEGVEVHGPVEQGAFLNSLGMRERVKRLVKTTRKGEGGEMEGQYRRLTESGEEGMGSVYKAMAIVPERDGVRPVGFGGGVAA